MAVFKMGSFYKDHIKQRATHLMQNMITASLHNFPLTHDDVQRALLDDEALQEVEQAEQHVGLFPRQASATFLLCGDVPGLKRHVEICIGDDKGDPRGWVFPKGAYRYRYDESDFRNAVYRDNVGAGKYLRMKTEHIPEHRMVELGEWINNVVLMNKRAKLVRHTVGIAMDTFDTTAKVLVNWPTLATLAQDDTLRRRFMQGPQKTAPHLIPVTDETKKLRIASDAFLTMALLMGDNIGKDTTSELTAALPRFQHLEGERNFT